MARTGRPRIEFTPERWKDIERMCHVHCTEEEICSILDVGVEVLQDRIKEQYNMTFPQYYKKHSAGGKMSLRRAQFALAEKNAAMAIWLGKQLLGQKDNTDISFTDGVVIKTNYDYEAGHD